MIECPNCGVVYRSRQYWFGNQDPVDTVVRTEIEHVWPGVSFGEVVLENGVVVEVFLGSGSTVTIEHLSKCGIRGVKGCQFCLGRH